MVQLGIAILLNGDGHNAIRRLQLAAATACGANPALRQTPHVTLKQPFHARALEPVEAYFDELVARTSPVKLHLHGLGTFEEDRVIFAHVEPDERLAALRLKILRDLDERFGVKPRDIEDERYGFHSTIVYGLTDEQFTVARDALAGATVDVKFAAETFGLFYYTGDTWIVYKRSHLRS